MIHCIDRAANHEKGSRLDAKTLGLLTCCLCLVTSNLLGQTPLLLTIDETEFQSQVSSIVDDKVTLARGNEQLDMAVLQLIRTGLHLSPSSGPNRVYLVGGGRLNASKVTFSGENFQVISAVGPLEFPAESISGVAFKTDEPEEFKALLVARQTDSDQVIAEGSTGLQTAGGLLESIDTDSLSLTYQSESRSIAISRVVAVVIADLQPPRITSPLSKLTLVDGSTVPGHIDRLEAGQLDLELIGGGKIRLPWSSVVQVQVQSNRVAYLSDLVPVNVVESSLATVHFPWQRDRSVEGNPLRFGHAETTESQTFKKGLGTHASCRLTFANTGDFNQFRALVGIDAETSGQGDCLASVWADGIRLWSQRVTAAIEPVEVIADIEGMKEITLVVEPGNHLDLGDHLNWARARFLRTR